MAERESSPAPGLKWRTRKDGTRVPYWIASKEAVQAGYPLKTVNLSSAGADVDARCRRLQAEMLSFLAGQTEPDFDGTLGSLLDLYERHEDSPYRGLKPSSLVPYTVYLSRLKTAYSDRKLASITGLDVKRWHKDWRAPTTEGGKERLGAAAFTLNVLKSALSFGQVCGLKHCAELRETLKLLAVPSPQARQQAPTAANIEAARKTAHDLGRHRAAFCYALQFETVVRQWDLIGQWVSLKDPRPSAVIHGGKKWIGPTFANIGQDMVLSLTPTKTERTTKAKVHVNLTLCPMVMEEFGRIPPDKRVGPLVINERTGLPYQAKAFSSIWRLVRSKAGLPDELWNRDIRAGGNTEAEMAGASSDDRAKLAGHSPKVNREVYSRDVLVSSNRVAEKRAQFRAKNAP